MFYSLNSFIRLADYLIVNTMHVLAVNSVSTLLNYLSEQLQNTPTLEQIQGFAEEAKQAADELKEDPETVSHTPTHPRPDTPLLYNSYSFIVMWFLPAYTSYDYIL